MVNSRHLHSLFLALGCALSGALAAWDGNVNLNKFAVKDASGKIAVLGTEGSWSDKGDVKEHVFDGVPSAPSSLNADTNTAMCAVLTWPDVANASGYLVWTNGVECAFVATNAATCARSARAHTTFGVSAVNGSAQSDRISLELPPAPPPPFILFFR